MIGFAQAGWEEEEAGSKTRRRWPELWAGSSTGAGKRWRDMRSWEGEPPGPGDLTGCGGVKSRKGVTCGPPASDWLVVSLTNAGNPKEAFGGWETSSVGAGVGAGTRAHVLWVFQFPSAPHKNLIHAPQRRLTSLQGSLGSHLQTLRRTEQRKTHLRVDPCKSLQSPKKGRGHTSLRQVHRGRRLLRLGGRRLFRFLRWRWE